MNDNERFKNAVIYGTSHPEIYMTKADELWEKYRLRLCVDWNVIEKSDFLAALAEYGQFIRDMDAEICRNKWEGAEFKDTPQDCAAAISREPMP